MKLKRRSMTRHIILLTSVVALVSCTGTTTTTSDASISSDNILKTTPVSLEGQVYLYAPDLDTLTCKATGECDCCSGQFLFLNDSAFVSADYCESDASYIKGTYRFVNGDLVITTDSICVNRQYNWAKETDTTGKDLPDYFISDTLNSRTTQTLRRIVCKNTVCFLMGDKDTYYVTHDNENKLSEKVDELKAHKVWERLNIKY